MTRTKWNGKDWRVFTCGECGYWVIWKGDNGGCRRFQHYPKFQEKSDAACPNFEPRDIPDPEYPDERTNMEHIRTEDRQ